MLELKEYKVCVTGANSFVGKNVRKFLSEKGISQYGIGRKNFPVFKNEKKIITSDFDNTKTISKLKKCQVLIHLIGTGRQTVDNTFENVNVNLTKKAIKLCKQAKIKKIIYISGLGVSNKTQSAYFISKYQAEKEIINSGLDYTILRASYIIGKNDPLSINLKKQIKKGTIKIPGSGDYHLQPIYVKDVARVMFGALFSKKLSKIIVDLTGPDKIRFNDFVRIFKNKQKVKIQNIDLEKAYYTALHNPAAIYGVEDLNIMVGDFIGNHKKLEKLCNFKFKKFQEVLKASSLP